jgi:hypothetical protein
MPTPTSSWRIERGPFSVFIVSNESPLIATVHDEWEAPYIVTACNAFPDLLEALETTRKWVDLQGKHPGCRPAADTMLKVIDAAIAKATQSPTKE